MLINNLIASGKFDISFAILFGLFIPLSKIENYKSNQNNSKKYLNHIKPKTILSQGTHIHDELYLHKFSDLLKLDSNIIIMQHGNNYNLINKNFHTGINTEYNFNNNLFTWGWTNYEHEIPISSPIFLTAKPKESLSFIFLFNPISKE